MNLTEAQLPALRAAIDAETDPEFVVYRDNGQTGLMAGWFNGPHASVRAWNSRARWADIQGAIDYGKYTPAVANMPTDVAGTNRLLGILIKLTVQQNMLLGQAGMVDATDPGTVDAVIDSVTSIQSGVGGAATAPGGASGVNAAQQMTRAATRCEAVYGGSYMTKGTVTALVLAWEGTIGEQEIGAALALP